MNPLPAPLYNGTSNVGLGFAVESMRRHMTNEGFEVFAGLFENGYIPAGYNLVTENHKGHTWVQKQLHMTDVKAALEYASSPNGDIGVVVLQDKREWEGKTAGPGFDPRETFTNVQYLASRPDLFKLTILKDAQNNPAYHAASAEEIGCHAWIVYYDIPTVCQLAPFLRPEHCIRTYHSVDKDVVPAFDKYQRKGCLLSGAVSNAYPLRRLLFKLGYSIPGMELLKHPGYGRTKCYTPEFLDKLSHFKVAICTASIYGYALRKIIEATAAGCIVVTDLPESDKLPEIDDNLVRIKYKQESNSEMRTFVRVRQLVEELYEKYDPERQRDFAERAKRFYDYRECGKRLVADIEWMRRNYNG